jgi:putative PIG3 family NAD(P)H quinone oxidoreductase
MRATVITTPGDPDVLQWQEVPEPVPAPDEVLIDVVAAGVNRADVLQRRGFYDPPPGESPYPGLECSGRVAALGPDVEGLAIGDEVCALLTGGGYAERVAVPAGQLLPVPAGLTIHQAAALPEVTATVWSNVFMLANLQPHETLLVHGGTSGIGTMAIQLAEALGTTVITTCGTDAKCRAARDLGADVAINYRDADFVADVAEATSGRGADVILDVIGAKYLSRNVATLAANGRLVVIGLQGGTKAEVDLNALLSKRAAILATSLRARPKAEKAAIVSAVRQHVWPLLADGTIRPVIDRSVPIEQAADAHRLLESSEHIGKVLLTVAH